MDDELQSIAYAKADFSTSNQLFVDSLIRDFPGHLRTALDIGCGPGDVVIRLARAAPDLRITAIDASAPMISLARGAVLICRARAAASRSSQGYVPGVSLPEHGFDAVLSKDLLHHLPDPSALWKEIARLGRPGAAVYVMDLVRPPTPEDAHRIVDTGRRARGSDPARGLLQLAVRGVHRRRGSRTTRRCRTRSRGRAGQRPAHADQRTHFTLALAFRRSAQYFVMRSETALRSASVIFRTRLRAF